MDICLMECLCCTEAQIHDENPNLPVSLHDFHHRLY
uniref:Uncharacterized protein n=1 Tax=Arundo donax TaxID=35708 RepID=A0A0A9ELA7_ARUDO